MGFFRRFPYSNTHDINLDWIIDQINDLKIASEDALAQLLATGIDGDSFLWTTENNTLIIRDSDDTELYRITIDATGITLTKGGGTPLTYGANTGILTAPVVNGTQVKGSTGDFTGAVTGGSFTTNGAVQAGSVVSGTLSLGTALPISSGGTGSTTASAALSALGAMPDTKLSTLTPLHVRDGVSGATVTGSHMRADRLVVVNGQLDLSADKTQSVAILDGLPRPLGDYAEILLVKSDRTILSSARITAAVGYLYPNVDITTGTYYLTGSYISYS